MSRILTPCMLDPISFDVDHPRGRPRHGETPRARMARLTEPLVHACRTQCPILDRCRTDPDARQAYGVVAGEYRPWPSDATLLTISAGSVRARVLGELTARVRRLRPGDRLPGAIELAQAHKAARNTVLLALKDLEADGLICRPPETRRSWIVTPNPTTDHSTETAA